MTSLLPFVFSNVNATTRFFTFLQTFLTCAWSHQNHHTHQTLLTCCVCNYSGYHLWTRLIIPEYKSYLSSLSFPARLHHVQMSDKKGSTSIELVGTLLARKASRPQSVVQLSAMKISTDSSVALMFKAIQRASTPAQNVAHFNSEIQVHKMAR